MILNLYLISEWSKSKSDFVVAVLQRDIGCPFSTNWYDSLGYSWNGLSGREKQTPFYLVKNSSVTAVRFGAYLFTCNELCSPAPLFCGRAQAIRK